MDLTISRILVPVDFSAHSELALGYATALASRFDASLHLLHVVEDPVATGAWGSEGVLPDLTELRKELVADAERRLKAYRSDAERTRVPVVTTAEMGLTSHTVVEYARALDIDLIVMGTHGRTGVAHLFMGSVAERVLRHAPCPVLTVRAGARAQEADEEPAHVAARKQ
ncbi:MAG: universal stress protein [Acidobacteria bacterium]|nr:universal stress protein [Acidobacteriota bacterium]